MLYYWITTSDVLREINDLFEKNEKLGKKIYITGKGRCNITSSLPIEEFIQNVPGNGMFLYSSFNNFTNQDIIELLKKEGLHVKEERGRRVFPTTDNAKDVLNVRIDRNRKIPGKDVLNALIKLLKKANVQIKTNAKVEKILVQDGKVTGLQANINGQKQTINADKIILATGGKSYPVTGSTGDGYELAKQLGHTITTIKPSLIPLTAKREDLELCKELQGLSLINVSIKLIDTSKNKVIYEDFGEMLFTHWGVSGPIILSGSAHLLRYKNVEELLSKGQIELSINLKPALTAEKLENRLLRDFEAQKNKEYKNSLNDLLPKKLIEPIIRLSGIDREKQVNSITKQERKNLVSLLQDFRIKISGFRPIEEAIVTSGGISTKEINPKTMESKIVHGLYFAGEIIDVDAYTGGFNLQIAWSTGYTAGM